MIENLIYVVIGIFLGWFLIPQPEWAKPIWDFVVGKIKWLFNKLGNLNTPK